MNLHVKNTLDKHESDIPVVDFDNSIALFLVHRKEWLTELQQRELIKPNNKLTLHPLELSIFNIYQLLDERELNQGEVDLIYTLEKRFVLTGDIYPRNSGTIAFNHCDRYFYLSAILLHTFTQIQDFNALNSAIRMIDKAHVLFKAGVKIQNIPDAIRILKIENNVVSGEVN